MADSKMPEQGRVPQVADNDPAESTAIDTKLARRLHPEYFGDSQEALSKLMLPTSSATLTAMAVVDEPKKAPLPQSPPPLLVNEEVESDSDVATRRLKKEEPKSAVLLTEKADQLLNDGWGDIPEEREASVSHSTTFTHLSEEASGVVLTGEQSTGNSDRHAARLICVAGPDKGMEFTLNGIDISIGRGPANNIVVGDPSMSRLHARIVLQEDRFYLVDEKSANGVWLDQKKTHRAVLNSGSMIKLGQTVLRFVEAGDVIKGDASAREEAVAPVSLSDAEKEPVNALGDSSADFALMQLKRQRMRKIALVVLGVSVCLAGIIFVAVPYVQKRNQDKGFMRELTAQEQAEAYFRQATVALHNKNFDLAKEYAKSAERLVSDNAPYHDYLSKIEEERNIVAQIEIARIQLSKRELDKAREVLRLLPDTTLFKEDLKTVKEEYAQAVQQATRVLQASNASVATSLPAVVNKEPSPPMLKREADKETGAVPSAEKSLPTEDNKPAPVAVVASADEPALNAFKSGNYEEAIKRASPALREKITTFKKAYDTAVAAAESKKSDSAVVAKKALTLESKFIRGQSTFAVKLRAIAAEASFNAGVELYNQQKYQEALMQFKQALSVFPDYIPARKKIVELTAKARDLYNQGLIVKSFDKEQAKQKWKTVLLITPAHDEIHQKARKMLEQLDKAN